MENLLKIRTEKNLSQVNVATKIGVAQETVSGYEIGRAFPTVETLLKLCDLLHVSADFLLDRTDVRTPVNSLVMDNFTKNELEILAVYRTLSPSKQERALGMLMGLSD